MYILPRALTGFLRSATTSKGDIGLNSLASKTLVQRHLEQSVGIRNRSIGDIRTLATSTSYHSKMAPITAWSRLVRYVSAKDGSVKYGEPIVSEEKPDIDALAQSGKLKVKVLEGANPIVAKPTGQEDDVKQLLGPLTPKDVPIVRCVGLNYRTHSK